MTTRAFRSHYVLGTLLLLLALPGCGWLAGVETRDPYPEDAATEAESEAAAESGPADDAAVDAHDEPSWGKPETCNLLDDNYDGLVDEGFEWTLGEWRKVSDLVGGEGVKTARLSNGTVMALLAEAPQQGQTRLTLVRVEADGTPSGEPAVEISPPRKIAGYAIARTFDDEVGVAYVESDDAGCSAGCPLRLARYRDGALVDSKVVEIDVPDGSTVRASRLFDLAATTAGYVFLIADEQGQARVNWLHQRFVGSPYWKGNLTGITPAGGALSVSGTLAWALGGVNTSEQQTVMLGITTPGGYTQPLSPKEPVQPGGGSTITLHPRGRAVAWLGADVLLGFTVRPLADTRPSLMLIDGSGVIKVDNGPTQSGVLHSVVEFRGGALASVVDGEHVLLQRQSATLKRIGGAIQFDDAAEHALIADGGNPVVIRISKDGSAAWVASLGCP